MTEPIVREASPADVDIIVRHRRLMFAEMGVDDPVALDRMAVAARGAILAALEDGSYRAWLAEHDGRVVAGGGIILCSFPPAPTEPNPRRPWILNVYTEHEWRRRGLARRLMQIMIDWCREQGFHNVSLHASEEGRPLYEDLGFRPTNEMKLTLVRSPAD